MGTFSPEQCRIKRKWSVDKGSGPLVMAGELTLKKLVQHSWPCQYTAECDGGFRYLRFGPIKGRQLGSDFAEALERACRIISADHRVELVSDGVDCWLVGNYYINRAGKLAMVKE